MSINILEQILCANLFCKRPITGFALKNKNRFCMNCQWSKLPKRWKCKREDCKILMHSNNFKTNKFYCSNECILLARKERLSIKKKPIIQTISGRCKSRHHNICSKKSCECFCHGSLLKGMYQND